MSQASQWPLVGHEWAVQQLQRAISNHRIRHAYLLTGPAAIGKTTLARALAMALNCTNARPPCGICRSCELITRNAHPDVSITQAERVGGTLKIDQIRELQHGLSLRPYEARYKVAILRRFHEANPATQNAILKTLEEPAPYVILILTADQPERLLPTITSRCQALNLRPLSLEQTYQTLHATNSTATDQKLTLLTRLSGGRLGWAIRTLDNPSELELRDAALATLEDLLTTDKRVARFQKAESLAHDKGQLRIILEYWLAYWRDALLIASISQTPIVNIDHEEVLHYIAQQASLDAIHTALESTRQALIYLGQNVNPRLCTDNLLLSYPYIKPA